MQPLTRERLDSLSILAVQGIDIVAQLAAGIWTARALGPDGNGDFAFAMSTVGMVAILQLFGTGEVAIRMHTDKALEGRAVLGAQLSIWAVGSFVAASAAALIGVVANVGTTPLVALAAAVSLLIANGLAATLNGVLLAHRLSRHDVWGMALSRLMLVIGVAYGVRFGVVGVMAAHALASLVLLTARVLVVWRNLGRFTPKFDRAVTRKLFVDGRHVGVGSLFGSVASRMDVVALRSWSGAHEAGLYGACYRILNGVGAITTAISLALYARLARARGRGRDREAERLFVAVPVVIAICLGIAALLASPLLGLLYGEAFQSAVPMFRILLAAGTVQTANLFLHKALVVSGRERSLPFAQGAQALTNLVLNFALVPAYGALGAAIATLACEFVVPIGHGVYFAIEASSLKSRARTAS